jgi:hypothetical protein
MKVDRLDSTEGDTIMKGCDFRNECFSLNEKTITSRLTTAQTKDTYCNGNFTKCTIYTIAKIHGIDKVPGYVLPGDKYELHKRIVENRSWVRR